MFLHQDKPKDYDCGYNMDLMIAAIPRIDDQDERIRYAKRVVGLIKQSHPNWVDNKGQSKLAWDYFFELAEFDPVEYGITNPFLTGETDDAR
ncbi:MAG: DUF4290 domain-containing protein [Balneolaceae bacterium]|nr:DUF4290 domain-containing protein [Balneolaceae bacterium]MCH8548699.1 DUF4290 domain-containing protein [Balneolaceae bacterium]